MAAEPVDQVGFPANPTFAESSLRKSASAIQKSELVVLAACCTAAENTANQVERQAGKSAAALLLESRIGEQFVSNVTRASEKGTWFLLFSLPVEDKLVQGFDGIDIGDRLCMQLIDTKGERGYIDFKEVNGSRHR